MKGTSTPIQTGYDSQNTSPPVTYTGQPVVKFKSNSPPVPALAKQIYQQSLNTLNCDDNNNFQLASTTVVPRDHNRPTSPELNSQSQFTYQHEMERRLYQTNDPEQYGWQQPQPIIYVPVSPHQLPTLYSQCSPINPVCIHNPQQPHSQIVSPVQIMVPLSPPQLHHQQEKRRENGMDAYGEDISQAMKHEPVNSSTQEWQDNLNNYSRDSKLPSIGATAMQESEHKDDKTEQSFLSASVTPQLSQQREAVLQHLAMMKKVCIINYLLAISLS